MMKIEYLGTGAADGIPSPFCDCRVCTWARRKGGVEIRSRAQALIDDAILLDFGPDTFYHTVRHHLSLAGLRYCLIGHTHADHLNRAELFARTLVRSVRTPEHAEPLIVASSLGVRKALFVDADGKIARDGTVLYEEIKAFESKKILAHDVIALPANHPTDDPLIYIIRKDGRTLLYAHDSAMPDRDVFIYLQAHGIHFDLISLDLSDGRKEKVCPGHLSYHGAKEVKEKFLALGLADAKTKFVLSHIGHVEGFTHRELKRLAKKDGFIVAYDGLTIKLRSRRPL